MGEKKRGGEQYDICASCPLTPIPAPIVGKGVSDRFELNH